MLMMVDVILFVIFVIICQVAWVRTDSKPRYPCSRYGRVFADPGLGLPDPRLHPRARRGAGERERGEGGRLASLFLSSLSYFLS